MHLHSSILAIVLAISACAPGNPSASADNSSTIQLTKSQREAIGKQIWQNESGGTHAGLTAWNVGEEFPSFGIGHFIWYPTGFEGRFEESWPQFIAYAVRQGVNPPAIARRQHSPWNSRPEFQRKFNSAGMTELRNWLNSTVALQTDFIIARSRAALPKVLAAAPASEREKIRQNYLKVATTPQGTYALIDYVNFKGDGTKPSERYNGRGWGLLQVLGNMKPVPAGPAAASEFAQSAKRMLSQRIENSPPDRGEERWRAGWHNRCDTYGRPL